MSDLQSTVAKTIGSKNVDRSAGAIAGFASFYLWISERQSDAPDHKTDGDL